MYSLICLVVPEGLGQELVLQPLELSGLEQRPTQCLLKEFKDIYYPTGEGMMDRLSRRQTKNLGRRRLRMPIHGFESLPHIPGNLSAMPNTSSECMQRKNLSDTPSWPLALHNQVKANTEFRSV